MTKTLISESERQTHQSSTKHPGKRTYSKISICGHCGHSRFISTSDEVRAHVCFRTSNPPTKDEDEDELEQKHFALGDDSTQLDSFSIRLIVGIMVCLLVVATICQVSKPQNKGEWNIERQNEACYNTPQPIPETIDATHRDTPSNGVVGLF
jgi:hypothetical protein